MQTVEISAMLRTAMPKITIAVTIAVMTIVRARIRAIIVKTRIRAIIVRVKARVRAKVRASPRADLAIGADQLQIRPQTIGMTKTSGSSPALGIDQKLQT
jgi:hypothetical protein